MCGRNSLFPPAFELETRFDASLAADAEYTQRYNIAPGSDLEVITNEAPDTIDQYHWGLIPFWANEVNDGFINARSETAHEKNVFRESWRERPCLVLSSGFYEWQAANGGTKQPYRIYMDGTDTFAMAGLWSETTIGAERIRSVTILTTEPNDTIASIHDRMPVVLPQDEEDTWLSADPDRRQDLCRPYPEENLDAYEIDRYVNNPGNDDPAIIQPADRTQSEMGEFGA